MKLSRKWLNEFVDLSLEEVNDKLEATIRQSGVTRFSVYLNRMIPSVQVNGRHVMLRKDS